MGLLNNYDGQVWRVNEMVELLENQDARHNLVREVVEYAVESHEAGIVVDFESIPDKSQANFREFVSELGSALHAVGLKLMVEVPARDDAYDYKFFGKGMRRDRAAEFRPALGLFAAGPDRRSRLVRRKSATGPASCARRKKSSSALRTSPTTGRAKTTRSGRLPPSSACRKRCSTPSNPKPISTSTSDSLNPRYSYVDENNHEHQVWMLDAVTGYNQLRASERLGVQGTMMFRLGHSDTSIWRIWDATRPDDAIARSY